MKRLTILVSLLLLTFPTFCQIGIVTQSGDSLIALPKKTVVFMIKDIVRGDSKAKEVDLLNIKIGKLNETISTQEEKIATCTLKIRTLQSTVDEYGNIDAINQKTIQSLNKSNTRLKKQRNAVGYFAAALLIGLIVR